MNSNQAIKLALNNSQVDKSNLCCAGDGKEIADSETGFTVTTVTGKNEETLTLTIDKTVNTRGRRNVHRRQKTARGKKVLCFLDHNTNSLDDMILMVSSI